MILRMRSTPTPAGEPDLLGLDNVRLDLPLAGAPSRILAAFVDHFLLFLVQVATSFGGAALAALLEIDGGWAVGLVILLFFLLQWGYFAGFEIALAGRTPGKMLMGLRAVSTLGGRPSASAFLIRNFLRNFDLVIGVPLMFIDRRHRRLGDLVAGTLVVHHRPERAEEEAVTFRHPDDWNAREVAVVESFLRRAEFLESDRAQDMAERLLVWALRRSPELSAAEGPESGPGSEEGSLPTALDRLRRLFWAGA